MSDFPPDNPDMCAEEHSVTCAYCELPLGHGDAHAGRVESAVVYWHDDEWSERPENGDGFVYEGGF